MALAFDAQSTRSGGFLSGNISWTHTPVGTPRAVVVYLVGDEGTDNVTSVSYGGVAMTQSSASPLLKATTEPTSVDCWILGSGIPAGAQTVSVVATGTNSHASWCVSLTGAANTSIAATATFNSASLANPSTTLAAASGNFVMIGFMSGQGTVANITPSSGWTSRREEVMGAQTAGFYTRDALATGSTTVGWTQTADDAVGIAIAIAEASGASVNGNFFQFL